MTGSETTRSRYSRSRTRPPSQRQVGRRSLYAVLSVIAAISGLRADSAASRLAPLSALIGIHDANETPERERLHAQSAEAVRAPEYLFEMKGTAPYGRVTHPGAMAAAPDGSVYVVDEEDHRVTRFDRDGNVLAAWGAYGSGDGLFDMPVDVAVAPDGSVYVSDGGNFRVQRFTAHGKHIATWGRQGVDDGSFRRWPDYHTERGPGAIAVDASGLVLVDDPGGQRVQVFSSDGTFLHAWTYRIPGTSRGEREIAALRVSPDNTLVMLMSTYVEASRHRLDLVRRFDFAGRLVDEWDISTELGDGVGLAIAADGTIYISNRRGFPLVGVYTADGDMIDRWVDKDDPEAHVLSEPVGIAIAPDGTGYIGDVWERRLWRFDGRGGVEPVFAVGPRAFGQQQPRSIATAPDGTFYVSSDERVHRFNGRSELVDVFEPGPLDEGFDTLSDIVVAPSGHVFGVEEYASRIHVFEDDGTPIGAWGEEGRELGKLFGPRWITSIPNGDILVYESTPGRIQRWTHDGSSLGLWLDSTYVRVRDIRSVPDDSADGYEILSLEGTCLVRRSPDARVIVRYDVYPDRPEMSCFRTLVSASSERGEDGAAMERVGRTYSTHATHRTSPSGVASIPIGPRAASRMPDGSYIVVTESELRHFSSRGALQSVQWGVGSRAAAFLNPSDLVVMPDTLDPDGPIPPGAIIVADSENHRLQVFGSRRPLWHVELFDNPWLMGYPAHITTTRAVDLDWSAPGTPLVAPAERFSARIDRRLYLSGTLEIRLETLGGARMWVGEELVVDEWLAESVDMERSLSMPYDAYLVRLELNGTESVSRVMLDLDTGDVPTPTLTPWPTHPPTFTPRPLESPVPTRTLPPPTLVIVPPSSTRTPPPVPPVYLPAARR